MKIFILAATFIVAIISADHNQLKSTSILAEKPKSASQEMKQYWMVMLYKGSNRQQSDAEAEKIQAAHMANINRLAAENKLIMAGPMGYDRDLRGIFVMTGKDSAEIADLVKTDSAILTGRLRYEIHPWWVQKGKYEFK